MWRPSTNSVLGSRIGQACTKNAFRLRLALSVFTRSNWNLGSFKQFFESIEFLVAESGVVNCRFIVHAMGQPNLFGLGREALQQSLNRPRLALARALPKQRGCLFRSALLN